MLKKKSTNNINKIVSKTTLFLLLSIFVLALVFRLFGINHGYPFVFHPDESTIVRSALGIRFELNPGHFDWPHLYIYANFVFYKGFVWIRQLFSPETYPFIYDESWIFYLLTRIFTAVLGAFTVFSVYFTAKNLFNTKVGLFSALAMAIVPFHIWHSHYALSDVPMVFLLSVALYFASKIVTKNNLSSYILAGLFVGFSASTKYNGGLSALMVPLATLVYVLENTSVLNSLSKGVLNKGTLKQLVITYISMGNIKLWVISGLSSLFGFLLGTPFALLDYDTFTRTDGPKGALWQFTNVGSVDLWTHIIQFFDALISKVSDDVGYTFFLGFILITGFSIYTLRRYLFNTSEVNKKGQIKNKGVGEFLLSAISKKDSFRLMFLSLIGLFLLWYISGFENRRSHYYMISYPFIVILAGYFISLFSVLKNKYVQYVIYLSFYLIPLFMTIGINCGFGMGDTRVEFYNWLHSEKPMLPVVYDFNDLDIVFTKVKNIKGYNGFNNMSKVRNGYLVLTNEDTYLDNRYQLELIQHFDNKYKRGPEIDIYTFTR